MLSFLVLLGTLGLEWDKLSRDQSCLVERMIMLSFISQLGLICCLNWVISYGSLERNFSRDAFLYLWHKFQETMLNSLWLDILCRVICLLFLSLDQTTKFKALNRTLPLCCSSFISSCNWSNSYFETPHSITSGMTLEPCQRYYCSTTVLTTIDGGVVLEQVQFQVISPLISRVHFFYQLYSSYF